MRRYLPPELPGFLFLLTGTIPWLIRLLDWIGRGEVLRVTYQNYPAVMPLLTRPVVTLIFIALGFAWLAYLQRQRQVEAIIFTAAGTPYQAPKYSITKVGYAAIALAAIIVAPVWI